MEHVVLLEDDLQLFYSSPGRRLDILTEAPLLKREEDQTGGQGEDERDYPLENPRIWEYFSL